MSIFGDIFRRRQRTNHPDGSRSVVVTDRHGNVRKTKHKGPSGTFKQRYDREGFLHKAKQKGRGVARGKRRYMRDIDPRIANQMSLNQDLNQTELNTIAAAQEQRLREMQIAHELQMQQMQYQMWLNQMGPNSITRGNYMPNPYTSPNSGMTMYPNFNNGGSNPSDTIPSMPDIVVRPRPTTKRKRAYKKGGGNGRGPNGIL
jgi:hypothetical protein